MLQELTTTEPSRFLYHYATMEGLFRILCSGNVRLGLYGNTNDPRENKEWVEAIDAPSGSAPASIDRLRTGARLACFTVDGCPSNGAEIHSHFHRGWARARMWAQYASHHTGVCLVFDFEDLAGRIDRGYQLRDGEYLINGPVSYIDKSLTLPMSIRTSTLDNIHDDVLATDLINHLYLTKNRDWESEREHRFVILTWAYETDTPIDIPFGTALRAVVLGEACALCSPASGLPRLETVDFYRCTWSRGTPSLQPLTPAG